ncbi:hypothetical protein ACS0TY_004103 [Phlomoides rotata]
MWYDIVITTFVEGRRMKHLTGVKCKELLIWVTISYISILDPSNGKMVFATPTGLSRSYLVSAFEEEKEVKVKN